MTSRFAHAPVYFAAAPWPGYLKLTSAFGAVLIAIIGIASYRAIPVPSGFTHYFGLGITLVLWGLLIFSALSIITGYTLSQADLAIHRLFWTTHIPLAGVNRAYFEPSICKGATRILGNAGLFGFTGIYKNNRLGRFRLFATDPAHAIVLELPGKTIVITPATTHAFIEHVHRVFPQTKKDDAHEHPVA